MENEGLKLSRFSGGSQLSQLIGHVVNLSAYVSHLHFLKFSPELFKRMMVL